MLLSLSHKFIFVANVKTASTSIEATLAPFAEIRLRKTEVGKHSPLTMISRRFEWVQRYIPYDELFVFGVIRDPVDHMLSLYNAHSREVLKGTAVPTRDMDFDTFLNVWCKDNWQAEPQSRRFVDRNGRFAMSHLVDYDKLTGEFGQVCAHLKLGNVTLKHLNISPENISRDQLTPEQIARIERDRAADYELLRQRPRAF